MEAVIFDIDGVIVDSEPLHYEAVLNVCSSLGLARLTEEENQNLLGAELFAVFQWIRKRSKNEISYSKFMAQIHAYYLSRIGPSYVRKGIRDVVTLLSSSGVKICCVTSADRKIAEMNIASTGLDDQIAFIVTRDDVQHTKPDPEPYVLALKKLGVEKKNGMAVEDTSTGIRSAQGAGLKTLAFPHPLSDIPSLSAADWLVNDLMKFPWQERITASS